jgi:hypothetical protein
MFMRHALPLIAAMPFLTGLIPAAQAAQEGSAAAAQPPDSSSCFPRRQWTGSWKASPDSRTVYIRVSNDVYALTMSAPTPMLQSAFAVLIDRDSQDTVCSPLDLRLVVTDRISAPIPLIVNKLDKLSPTQVEALPKKLRP